MFWDNFGKNNSLLTRQRVLHVQENGFMQSSYSVEAMNGYYPDTSLPGYTCVLQYIFQCPSFGDDALTNKICTISKTV